MRKIAFGDLRWTVRRTALGPPGPNLFDERNVTLLPNADLLLEITRRDSKWTCAELQTVERFGLGAYQFWVIGRIDLLDPRVVFGFFPYPTSDIGPDGTHEIDIEFARWGDPKKPCGNFTVCPTVPGNPSVTHAYPIQLDGDYTTHRIVRRADRILFSSYHGHRELNDTHGLIGNWEFRGDLSSAAMPLHLNFWLFRGKAPLAGKGASLILRALRIEA